MTYKLELGEYLTEMPKPFRNLYQSIGRVSEYKFDAVNRFLETEPYKAALKEYIGVGRHFNRIRHWYMEFNSKEDYVAFLVKWS